MNRKEIIQSLFQDFEGFRRRFGKSHGIGTNKQMPTHTQVWTMIILAEKGPKSPKELAEQFCMSASAVTQLIDPLVKDRLVARTEDDTDRRKIEISLTKAGFAKLEDAKAARVESLVEMLTPLSDDELLQLAALYKKIIHNSHP